MIGRGKQNEVYLYEITEQDLLINDGVSSSYRVGNILLFASKRSVNLGNELARADDFSAALEYLGQLTDDKPLESETKTQLPALVSQGNLRDESLRVLTEKIEQRDELLRDLSETLQSQKQDNELLHAQLKHTQAQLAVDELKCNELVDDLQHISEETFTMGSTLEHVMEEKFQLEQELAERITELIELSLQNDDLRKQRILPSQGSSEPPASKEPVVAPIREEDPCPPLEPQVLTMASGKQIHILHEFPAAPKLTPLARAGHTLVASLRILAISLFAVLVLSAASVITTAQVNHISFGDALDLLLLSLKLL